MIKAFSYIRFSSEAQKQGDSLRRQKELSENYAKSHNLQLVENYQDLGVSAFKGKHKENALGLFLEAIKKGKIEKGSYLLIESLDRLSREKILDAFSLFTDIIKHDIIIVTLQDEAVYDLDSLNNNIGSLFMSMGIMLRANNESEAKSKRLSSAWSNKRLNHDKQIITSKCPSWLKANDDKTGFEIIEDKTDTIRLIYDFALKGYGAHAITKYLNQNGILPIGRGKKWIISYIKKILHDVHVIGEFQPYKKIDGKRIPIGEPIEKYYPSVISKQLFQDVQDIIKAKGVNSGGIKGERFSNLFRGLNSGNNSLLKCGKCGESIVYKNKGNRLKNKKVGEPYFECNSLHIGKLCHSTKWYYQDFEDDFFRFVREFDIDELLNDDSDNERKNKIDELNRLRTSLDADNKRLQGELITLSQMDNLSVEILAVLDERVNQLKECIKEKEERVRVLEAELKSFEHEQYVSGFDEFKKLSERLDVIDDDSEVFHIRQKINTLLNGLIKSIHLFNGFKIEPYEVYNDNEDTGPISKGLNNWLVLNGYDTKGKQERFFELKKGQRKYDESERYFLVTFKNLNTVYVKPFESFVIRQDNQRIKEVYERNKNL